MVFIQKIILEVATGLIIAGLTYVAQRHFFPPQPVQAQAARTRQGVPVRPNRNCPVCLRPIDSPLEILPCNHLIHADCLKKCLVANKSRDRFDREELVHYFDCMICGMELSREQIRAYRDRI